LIAAASQVREAVAALRAERLVVYPTETVYGLGADATSHAGLAALLSLKGRSVEKGMSVLVADLDSAAALLDADPPAGARALAQALWPGPLTLILPAASSVPAALVGTTGGVGLRCSPDPLAAALVRELGRPITATSANPSGRPPATNVALAREYFGDRVACYLDGGPRAGAAVSTVVEFLEGRAILRRAGAVEARRLASIVPLQTSES
jgi:tRNA threonylcarbamoyl adenosine modification protein (Sua5/YciO/YrdC/YwlC family)